MRGEDPIRDVAAGGGLSSCLLVVQVRAQRSLRVDLTIESTAFWIN